MKVSFGVICTVFLGVMSFSFTLWAVDSQETIPSTITREDKEEAERVSLELPEPEDSEGEYSDLEQTNEIIVTFAEGAEPQEVLRNAEIRLIKMEEVALSLPVAIDNAKQNTSQSLGKDSNSWYWFKGKKYKEVNNEEEKFTLQYKILLAKGMTALQAIEQLKDNPNVESVMPVFLYIE
ncbi:MAG: hypothetical protein JSW40_00500 [Candidatus Omnitrophota bacterium]|nr:MAG: hypothetical protein JSW40_00500 [Candidatus Omnitrophota bacterium]